MTPVFADAVYLIALANPRDQYHDQALGIDLGHRSLVTTQYVMTEVANSLSRIPLRQLFLSLAKLLENWKDVSIRVGNDDVYQAAVDLYRRRPDKDWSLTDCTSFVVMEREGLKEVLTADHHFEQAGFVALFS